MSRSDRVPSDWTSSAEAASRKGLVVVISGPSGVGKSTICKRLVERLDAVLSVSATTRPKRDNEVDGRDYYFLTPEQFERKVAEKEFIEHAEYDGNLYGTPAGPVREAVAAGRIVLLEIEVQGGRQVRELFPDAVMIFVIAPSMQDLVDRLDGRHTDPADARQRRLRHGEREIRIARESGTYAYFVTNDVVDKAVDRIVAIVQKERRAK